MNARPNRLSFKTIALIELYDHGEVLQTVCELLDAETENILVLSKPQIKYDLENRGLQSLKIQWHLIGAEERYGDFFKRKESILSQCDWVFLLTVNRPFALFASLKFLDKAVLLIHNVHAFLDPWRSIYWSREKAVEIFLRQMRFWLSGDFFALRQLLKKSKIWAFPSTAVLTEAETQRWIPKNQAKVVLPFALFPSTQKVSPKKGTTKICIPGTIKSNGRDYQLIVRVFRKILKEVKNPIQVCLLGVAKGRYGERVQALFQQLANSSANLSVIFYTTHIPQSVFNTQLLETDFMVLPLTAYSQYDGFLERLGYSTISGGVNDALRFGLPTLISASYGREESWGDLIQLYHSELELEMYMKNWILNNRKLITDKTLAHIKLNGEKMRRIFLDSLLSN